MHSFGVRGYKTSAGMEWKVTLFGERYVNVRHRGSVSGGGYSAGGDYRNVDFEPDTGRRVKASAVKDWAESNVSFSGYYKGTSWQEDPFDSPGHRGGSVTIGASY